MSVGDVRVGFDLVRRVLEQLKAIFHPSDRQLRQFAAVLPWAVGAVAWWWGASGAFIGGAIAVCTLWGAIAWLRPALIWLPFVIVSVVGLPIRMMVQETMLLAVYWLLFVPVGLWFRVTGRDRLKLKLDPKASTYWEELDLPAKPTSYYRQF